MRALKAGSAAIVFTGAALFHAGSRAAVLTDTPTRDDEPVLVAGSSLGEFAGRAIDHLAVFRWNPATSQFDPIPFQIDQRVNQVFDPGTPVQFTELMYDVLGTDDGLLDSDDELAFMFGDAGPAAPGDTVWVPGADEARVELRVLSSIPGQNPETRWVYVFAGPSLPRSPTTYVQWDELVSSAVTTPVFTIEYQGRWLLTGLRVAAPCGSGADLIDRVKGRAKTNFGNQEDEENWNQNSTYLGGIVGPVRAIRYVRGAASALNTIHHDIVYRRLWRREVNLRVHPLASASLYIDWRSIPGARYFSPTVQSGVLVDGVGDSVPTTFVPWKLITTPQGGIAVVHEIPASPLYQSRIAMYKDDASYNDQIPEDPAYSDEDNSAFGDTGVQVLGLSDTNVQPIAMWTLAYPLCANVGDGTIGASYRQFFDNPLQLATIVQQHGLGAVRTLTLARGGNDLVLTCQPVSGATSYQVLTQSDPSAPQDDWTLLGETASPTWSDVNGLLGGSRYYSIIAVGPNGEGDW